MHNNYSVSKPGHKYTANKVEKIIKKWAYKQRPSTHKNNERTDRH